MNIQKKSNEKKSFDLYKKISFFFLTIFLIAIIIFVFLIISEYILKKYIGLGNPVIYKSHSLWGYAPQPNTSYKRYNKFKIRFNNIGARSNKNWNDNKINIIFLGDSVTYGGSYINNEQTFANLTCENQKKYLCHNFGVNAHGILNMVARSRYDDKIKNADVFVFFFTTEDFSRGLVDSNTAHFILRQPPKYFSALWEILNFSISKIKSIKLLGKKSDTSENHVLLSEKFALDILKNEINRIKNNKKKYLLVHSPSVKELRNSNIIENNLILNYLKDFHSKNTLLLHEFFLKDYSTNIDSLFVDEVHYTKMGHRVASEIIKNKLFNFNE